MKQTKAQKISVTENKFKDNLDQALAGSDKPVTKSRLTELDKFFQPILQKPYIRPPEEFMPSLAAELIKIIRLKPVDKLIILELGRFGSTASVTSLSKITGYAVKSVREACKKLVEYGYLNIFSKDKFNLTDIGSKLAEALTIRVKHDKSHQTNKRSASRK